MFGKTAYLLAFLVSIAIFANAAPDYSWEDWSSSKFTKPSEITIGQRVPGDRLILRQSIVKGSKWLRKVTVEKTFEVDRYDTTITMVRLVDKSTNGKGATAEVAGGGPGFSTVNVLFKSRRGHGIKYEVEIYGRPA